MNVKTLSQKQSTPKTFNKGLLLTGFLLSTAMTGIAAEADSNTRVNEVDKVSRSMAIQSQETVPKVDGGRHFFEINKAQANTLHTIKSLANPPMQRKTREQVIAERQEEYFSKAQVLSQGLAKGSKRSSVESSDKTTMKNDHSSSYYVTFEIYDATTRLFEDLDYDGFFQSFSVTFDADVYAPYADELAYVFADLYLSRNGGPWELYHTTDEFAIIDDRSDDAFEVITHLASGYDTDHYDVLIDLYELGYSDIVASISSENVDSLYALPLESADADEYLESVSHSTEITIGGGSYSTGMLLLLLSVVGIRALLRR